VAILFPATPGDPAWIVTQAHCLADDVEKMLSGAPLPVSLLAGAPVIDAWRPALRNDYALMGVVACHPAVIDGRQVLPSEVYAIDIERGFART
jgi:hypothetical protein